ncbi:hypothetical protein R1sor_021861 [Riccia sorocarpa]|uniref:Plant heme peroxidase family profile domain-containing protein n=1 Tax=Riccia sorocarpa TaxID=122646 RepID=A0ABD3GLD2_9MARC
MATSRIVFFGVALLLVASVSAQLNENFYAKTCPGGVQAVAKVVTAAIGGPKWKVPLGRRDGSVSLAREALSNLPGDTFTFQQLVSNFAKKGLNEADMVVLSGAHTIGLTHCFKVTSSPPLPESCAPTPEVPQTTSFISITPTVAKRFDVNYFKNILNHQAVFKSDSALISTSSGRSKVVTLANSQSIFFSAFGAAMEKMGRVGVLTGRQGKIRTQCSRR